MRRITHALAAVATLAALAPLGSAQAEEPFFCAGAPSQPATYACIVGFQVGADPVVGQQEIEVKPISQPVGGGTLVVPSQNVGTTGQPYVIPEVCAGPDGFCVGPLEVTPPAAGVTTPPITVPLPSATVTTPGVSQTISTLGVSIPPGAVLVLYYNGTCHYVWPDGSASKTSASAPDLCP